MLQRVKDYLDRLPNGAASYGFCQVKGSIFSRAVSSAGVPLGPDALPPEVVALVHRAPAASDWVSEVHYNALSEAIYGLRFSGPGGDEAHDEWMTDLNRKLFTSPLYKVMFLVVSPDRMYAGAARRWASFHRGSVLTLARHGPGAANLRLTYPARLFPEHKLRGFGVSFQVAAEAAGGRNVSVTYIVESDSSSLYGCSWT